MPATAAPPEVSQAVIELIYSGMALVCHSLGVEFDAQSRSEVLHCRLCGSIVDSSRGPVGHQPGCPAVRFFAAVEAARRAAL